MCFLGLGYERANLDKLGIEHLKSKKLCGTTFGLPEGQRAAVNRYFTDRGCRIDLRSPDEDVLQFFKNTDVIHD